MDFEPVYFLALPFELLAIILSGVEFEDVLHLMHMSPDFYNHIISSNVILQSLTYGRFTSEPHMWYPRVYADLAVNLYNRCVVAGNWDILFQRYLRALWNPFEVTWESPAYLTTLSAIERIGIEGYDFALYTAAIVYLKERGNAGEEKGLWLMKLLTDRRVSGYQIVTFRRELREEECWTRMHGVISDRHHDEHKCLDHPAVDRRCRRCFAKLEVRKYLKSHYHII